MDTFTANGPSEDSYEPIAIVGMVTQSKGCRLPGESYTPSNLWDNLLKDGKSAWSELPKGRFNLDAWYHPDGSRPGSVHTRGGYFLSHDEHLRQFDPSFFGISPLEAASMDPQQRKLLEVVYESFENAGATLEEVSGSKTSCFIGCFTNDMHRMTSRDFEYGAPYEMTGSDMTILSNRINYVFDLKGPSMTVDTACSSSLYALHLACQSLVLGDSDAAVAGGSNIINDIEQHIASVRLGVLSPTSTCHTFDERADGFGRGEGICAIYIKKLSAAIANNDPIRAVIRATAVNSNGRSQGINNPSSKGQEAVIREAYTRANLRYEDTGYFECHGTGTPVGDPIEVRSTGDVFASGRTPQNPLLLSSIKTNIGHTEGASGLASVIKAVLSIENNLIPATVGVNKLNPAIDFKGGRLEVVRITRPWPEGLSKRVSINSFGYGGANAHCIVESPDILLGPSHGYKAVPSALTRVHDSPVSCQIHESPKRYLFTLSAHDQLALDKTINALAAVADEYPAVDIAYTLAAKRTKHRISAFASVTEPDLKSQLMPERSKRASEMVAGNPTVAFVFTGQGAQWPTMGYGLVQQYPIVRETMATLQSALDLLPEPPTWRLVEELCKPAEQSRMHETALAQPLSTALQIALTVLLQSWGIRAKAVVGHSSGEVAAAFCAGLLTGAEAIAVAYYRGIAVTKHGKPGAMMAVGLGSNEVSPYIQNQPDIVVACQNSPQSVTLSGGAAAIAEVHACLSQARIFSRVLNTSQNAYHSHLVKEAGQYYEDSFRSSLKASTSISETTSIPMYSCINGEVLDSPNKVRIDYWRKNLENPVNFTQALSTLIEAQPTINCLIEVGMHSALAGPIKQIRSSLGIKPEKLCYLPSIIRGGDNVEDVLDLAGVLWTVGFSIDLTAINGVGNFLPNLPTHQWNYESDILWSESRLSHQVRFRKHARHDLLGTLVVPSSANNPTWRNRLKIKNVPWLADHQIGHDVIFPAAGYCAMAVEAVTQSAGSSQISVAGYTVRNLSIKSPLVIAPDGEAETLFDLHLVHSSNSRIDCKTFEFSLSSVNAEDKWTEHALGKVVMENSDGLPSIQNDSSNDETMVGRSDDIWYAALAKIGLRYGPTFRPLTNIRGTEKETATAWIDLKPTKDVMIGESRYAVHPATLDACIQLAVIAACKGDIASITKAYLPTTIEHLTIWQNADLPHLPARGLLSSHGTCHGMRSVYGSSELVTLEGRPLAQMAVSLLSLEGGFADQKVEQAREPFTRLVWQPIADQFEDGAGLSHPPDSVDHCLTPAPKLWLVYKDSPHSLAKRIETCAKGRDIDAHSIPLSAVHTHMSEGARVLMLAELEGPMLLKMTSKEMDAVKTMFELATSVLWITPGGLLKGKKPAYSLFSGMINSITKAQPSLRLSNIDIDSEDDEDMHSHMAKLILQYELNLCKDDNRVLDNQLVVSNGILYASRYIPDEHANHDFARQLRPESKLCLIKGNLELTFEQVGRMESFYFKEKPEVLSLRFDELRLRPIAYALGQREANILRGTQFGSHFSNICIALVENLGFQAKKFKPGDRVVCYCAGRFDNPLVVSETQCELLEPQEADGDVLVSLLPYCAAIHALRNVTERKMILIYGLPQTLAVAATRYSQAFGCKVILTYESEDDIKSFKIEYPDISDYAQCITDLGMAAKLSTLTEKQGVDLALIHPKSSTSPEIWRSLARNGCLMYILEDSEMPNLSLLDPSVFARGASVISSNVYDMLATQPEEMCKLVQSVLGLLRDGTLPKFAPAATYDVSDLPAAVAAISQAKTATDIILTFDSQSVIPIYVPYEQVSFSSESSYLLIGCLGGLGRSLVRWMVSRGATHFVFLSRSGADKPEAAEFINELEEVGGKPIVVRGDVSIRAVVNNAIEQAKTPIKGVMQLAMALTSDLFENMSIEDWRKVLAPKVQGTINLHEALLSEPLDFFVMTSSTLGIAGASTQSNYAAANAFLDSMARHRWSLGLEACSIALGMVVGVGHMESHPDVKAVFQQRNVYGIPEDDFLRMMEMACRPRGSIKPVSEHDPLSVAHMVTGMEPSKVANSGVQPSWLTDPRFSIIAAAIAKNGGQSTWSADSATTTTSALRTAIASDDDSSIHLALQSLVLSHFSKLIMAPMDKLTASLNRPMSEFGMDSMIVADLRSWAWRDLRVDLPFMVLLEGGLTLDGLVKLIWSKLDWDSLRDA
ncbi:ketoacyl-synt-domain-containing protein [Aureobasidium sp. EXF-10727]|nr:ketoacyl-synt-domain-containing protein [Aureobasidium sp. EXF-10727]